jgi:predicted lipoprotein with Yx(FWY)xxD motif
MDNNYEIIERSDGSKFWFLNHKLHRTDGPAVEFSDGTKYWYLNGKQYSFSVWCKKIKY